jgi:hypothetical protein
MKPPASRFQKVITYSKSDYFMQLSIFEFSDSFAKLVYVNGLKQIIHEIFDKLGGNKQVSILLNQKSSKIKEWKMGRKPIKLSDLNKLISCLNPIHQENIKHKIDAAKIYISCRYSNKKILFPKRISLNLAYVVGLLLGDGSLTGDNSNASGNWTTSLFCESKKHGLMYSKIMKKIFDVNVHIYRPKENLFVFYCSSKALHLFFQDLFEIKNGFKCDKIIVPKRIFNSSAYIRANFLSGLFDTDGTFTCKKVKYATTSKTMSEQVKQMLSNLNIKSYINMWQKKGGNYKPLYTVSIYSKCGLKVFSEKINFRHPNKKLLLANFIDSSVV